MKRKTAKERIPKAPLRSKYGAVRTGKYASKLEANEAAKLHALHKAGKIFDLKEQVKFVLVPGRNKVQPITYIADFTFVDGEQLVVADAKGFKTPVYKLKKRMLYLLLGITIEEL